MNFNRKLALLAIANSKSLAFGVGVGNSLPLGGSIQNPKLL
jgi:hypothetical protein